MASCVTLIGYSVSVPRKGSEGIYSITLTCYLRVYIVYFGLGPWVWNYKVFGLLLAQQLVILNFQVVQFLW